MKEKTRYTDEPMEFGPPIRDFLPSPDRRLLDAYVDAFEAKPDRVKQTRAVHRAAKTTRK